MTAASPGFWEQPDVVRMFAERAPDHRLVALVPRYADPSRVRVLDLGCAGGRNTVFLAERGFTVLARDLSAAMVEETHGRLARVLGVAGAEAAVRQGPMDDLAGIPDASIDLLVALGIYHAAGSREVWDRTLRESFRVAARGACILVSNFGPGHDPAGKGLTPVPGEPHVFEGFSAGRGYLLDAASLDAAMASHGFRTLAPTETVRRETEGGRRVTVNGLYQKP